MALNFDKKAVMNLDEPITDNEIESVLTEYETLTQNIEGSTVKMLKVSMKYLKKSRLKNR